MKQITVKYDGECRICGAEIEAGEISLYDRGIGLICITCGEPDIETLRVLRQAGADRKADRLEGFALKRRAKAAALLDQNKPYEGDHAFCTQPGHIPEREKVNRRAAKAWEHQKTADDMERRAKGVRRVRVKGDAERKRAEIRDRIRPLLKVGMKIDTPCFSNVTIIRLNPKSVTIETRSGYKEKIDYSWISIPSE